MTQDQNTTNIHEFDVNLICEYFSHLERQGPGSPAVTLQALSFIDNVTQNSEIADIGCGTGGQTITLAQNIPGHLTAIDIFPKFIDILNTNAKKLQLTHKITGIVGSMASLPFQNEQLDLIWAEGSIYNIGFQKGLQEWHRFLKPGGYLAISEASWFTETRPEVIAQFWNDAYPEIDTIANQIAKIQQAGYAPVAAFMLPENCWTENFFKPQIPVQEAFLKKYPTAANFISYVKHEATLYDKYKAYYGYTFFIGRKL